MHDSRQAARGYQAKHRGKLTKGVHSPHHDSAPARLPLVILTLAAFPCYESLPHPPCSLDLMSSNFLPYTEGALRVKLFQDGKEGNGHIWLLNSQNEELYTTGL